MAHQGFNTDRVKPTSAAFPQAVIADKFIFLSGTPGIDPLSGMVNSNDFEAQARQSFENIKTILEAAGANMTDIVKTTIFMVAGNDFATMNKVYTEFFPENPPARSMPQVMPFPAGMLISIECIAMKDV